MAKRSLVSSFILAEQPILDVAPKPQPVVLPKPKALPARRDHRENRRAFTVWLDADLVARLRTLSRELVTEHGRAGNSIERLVTEGIEHVLEQRKRS